MARLTATDINLVMFTISASSYPTTTQVGNLITNLYKQAYAVVYGTGHYSSDDSTDTESIINTAEMSAVLENIATEFANLWFLSGKNNPPPSFKLTKKDEQDIAKIALRKRNESGGPVSNVRLWNEPEDDFWYPRHDWGGIW